MDASLKSGAKGFGAATLWRALELACEEIEELERDERRRMAL